MKSTRSASLVPLAFLGLAACSSAGTESAPIDTPEPSTDQGLGSFVLHVSPSKRTMKVYRLSQKAAALVDARGPGAIPQAVSDVSLTQDNVTGSNGGSTSNNTVELVTTSTNIWTNDAVNCGTSPSFCADVTLNSFWTRTLNYTYAQVTAVTDSTGQPITGHGPISGGSFTTDTAPSGAGAGAGGWLHTSDSLTASQFSGAKTGAMLPWSYNGGGNANGGTRRWVFANPDGADTYVALKVWGTPNAANYTITSTSTAAPDACDTSSGTAVKIFVGSTEQGQPIASNNRFTAAVPFAFTHYATTYAASNNVAFSKWGNVTFGSAPDTSGSNVSLPAATGAPKPGVFPFWDNLRWPGSITLNSAGLCARQYGSAPTRRFVLTWKKIGATGNGPFMNMHATLVEGSNQIWFHYNTILTGTGTYSGTIGTQNESGTVGVSQSSTGFSSPTAFALIPTP